MNFDKLYDDDFDKKILNKDLVELKEYLLKKKGWVYIATQYGNNHLKIGRTGKSPLNRAKTLSPTGVLYDYEIFFSLPVFNQFIVESKIQKKLKKYRVSKEFFSVSKEAAIKAIEEAYNEEWSALSRFINLEMIKEDLSLLPYAIL